MKRLVAVIATTVLFSPLGTTAPAYAQEEQHQEQAKPEQHAQQTQQAQRKQKTSQAKSSQNAQRKQGAQQSKSEQHAQQQNRTQQANSSRSAQKQEGQQSRSAQGAQREERAPQARPARQTQRASNNRGGRIPDDRFRAHFGREHSFRVDRLVMVSGSRRFQYGGHWFEFVDPWPAGCYYTDQVYVDYMNGGYYLLSPVHPGIQISISVIL
jgi:hypothetical protein